MAKITIKCWHHEKGENPHNFVYDTIAATTAEVTAYEAMDTDNASKDTDTNSIKGTYVVKCPVCDKDNEFVIISDKDKTCDGTAAQFRNKVWMNIGQKLLEGSTNAIKSSSDKIIALDTGLITIYTGLLTFLKIQGNIVLLVLPIIIWLASIVLCMLAYFVGEITFSFERPDKIKEFHENLIKDKYKSSKIGHGLFILGLLLASIVLVVGSTSQPMLVQFNVAEEYVPAFENMSITVNNQTMNTMPLTLIEESDTYFKVQLDNGRVIRLSKDMVNGVMDYTNTP